MTRKSVPVLFAALVAIILCARGPSAQEAPSNLTVTPAQDAPRNLWIAKFSCDTKAAMATAASQNGVTNALKYSNLFANVKTFETDATKPEGTWSLTAKEIDFSGGSAATRALVGLGSGRSHIEIEYSLADPTGKVVWTAKIKTKPSWWGSAGVTGAIQNQGAALDAQGQKVTEALAKYFGAVPPKK